MRINIFSRIIMNMKINIILKIIMIYTYIYDIRIIVIMKSNTKVMYNITYLYNSTNIYIVDTQMVKKIDVRICNRCLYSNYTN